MKYLNVLLLTSFFFTITSCSHMYYKSWEFLGKEKRDLLVSNVDELNSDQSETKEELQSVLDKIRKEYNFSEGELESTYDEMKGDYEDLKEEADDLKAQLEKVKSIAEDLFEEWKDEAEDLENKKYRKDSLKSLSRTKSSFSKMIQSAEATEVELDKAVKKFNEQVVYTKHNLNAKMVGKLNQEVKGIEKDMQDLIKKIESAIANSKKFLDEIK